MELLAWEEGNDVGALFVSFASIWSQENIKLSGLKNSIGFNDSLRVGC